LASTKAGGAPSAISDARVKAAGLGQIVVSDNPSETLVAYGLGSCIGVVGYDGRAEVGGLLHALLPQHRNGDLNHAKFVDTGIPLLVQKMEELGASRRNTVWYVVGGAQMLTAPGLEDSFQIGRNNADIALRRMAELRLRVKASDVGGSAGRTVRLDMSDGAVYLRTLGQKERVL